MSVQQHSTVADESLTTKFPPEPSAYRPKDEHFLQMKRDRCISGRIINKVFTEGKLESAKYDRFKFVHEIDGYEWWFIVEYKDNGPNDLVTAYVPAFNDHDGLYQKNIL